ncbi:DNA (cytosine-5-)-methyltransferase [Facklamia sp. P12950]|uniref:DNA (cytosine-5-)-methyltransferase n=1 Tax=Facklamia sp. P12950 TaxID=3421951 RepID=UPI003D17785D
MEKRIKIASLFSGIGGFEEGLKFAGINFEIVFASEIDKFAQTSFLANFHTKNLYGDITKIKANSVPDHDLLLAGFPCQAFSIAGKRMGFEDTRGTLFYDVARILDNKKPKFIFLENVKNLIGHDGGKTINEILKVLEELNYTVDFTIINSMEAGIPQNRERTYIFGVYNWKTEEYLPDKRNAKINKLKQKLNIKKYTSFNFFNSLDFKKEIKVIDDVLLEDVDEKFFINTKEVSKFLESLLVEYNITRDNKIIKLFDLPKDVHNDLERQRRVYSTKGISPTLLARTDSPKILINDGGAYKIRKLTPEENFLIQGFGEEFVKNIKKTGMSNTQMYKQSGNAVSPPVIAGIMKKFYKEFVKDD